MKVTLTLKNQPKKKADIIQRFRPEPNSPSFTRAKNEMNVPAGCPQFALQSDVFDEQNGELSYLVVKHHDLLY